MENEEFHKLLHTLARGIDASLTQAMGKLGFVLLVFPFNTEGDGHQANYVSNANKHDIIKFLRDAADRLEDNEAKKEVALPGNKTRH